MIMSLIIMSLMELKLKRNNPMSTAEEIRLMQQKNYLILTDYQKRFNLALWDILDFIAIYNGYCPKCILGYVHCLHCGGTGVNREILRQT